MISAPGSCGARYLGGEGSNVEWFFTCIYGNTCTLDFEISIKPGLNQAQASTDKHTLADHNGTSPRALSS